MSAAVLPGAQPPPSRVAALLPLAALQLWTDADPDHRCCQMWFSEGRYRVRLDCGDDKLRVFGQSPRSYSDAIAQALFTFALNAEAHRAETAG